MLTDNQVIMIFLTTVGVLFGSLYVVYLWGTNKQKQLDEMKQNDSNVSHN